MMLQQDELQARRGIRGAAEGRNSVRSGVAENERRLWENRVAGLFDATDAGEMERVKSGGRSPVAAIDGRESERADSAQCAGGMAEKKGNLEEWVPAWEWGALSGQDQATFGAACSSVVRLVWAEMRQASVPVARCRIRTLFPEMGKRCTHPQIPGKKKAVLFEIRILEVAAGNASFSRLIGRNVLRKGNSSSTDGCAAVSTFACCCLSIGDPEQAGPGWQTPLTQRQPLKVGKEVSGWSVVDLQPPLYVVGNVCPLASRPARRVL
jgi:hypothetical protein